MAVLLSGKGYGADGREGSPDGMAMPVVGVAVTETSAGLDDVAEADGEAEADGCGLPLEPPLIIGGPGMV